MTARQKFWLKVVLAVTSPLWVLPVGMMGAVFVFGLVCWETASDLVEPSRRHGDLEDDGP